MRVKTSYAILQAALEHVNSIFNSHFIMHAAQVRTKDAEKCFRVRLEVVKNSKKRSRSVRQKACWHVYGVFIDKIFELDRIAEVHIHNLAKFTWWNWYGIQGVFNPDFLYERCSCK